MKKIVIVDITKQSKEKNSYWGDYPTMNYLTKKALKNNLDHYYNSWGEYMKVLEKYNIDDSMVKVK